MYIEYTADDGTDGRILVTLPGRLPLCHICELDSHHPSQCKKKPAEQASKECTDISVQTDRSSLKSARTQTAESKKRTATEQESSSQEGETIAEGQQTDKERQKLYTISEMRESMPTHVIDLDDSHPR